MIVKNLLKISSVLFFITGCSTNQARLNNMNSGIVRFFIPNGFYIKETPGDWVYKNNPIETPFVAQTIDRNLTVYGTLILREDDEKATAKITMITNNKDSRLGSWNVYNCSTKKRYIEGERKQKVEFKNNLFIYQKGYITYENCGMINLNKNLREKKQ